MGPDVVEFGTSIETGREPFFDAFDVVEYAEALFIATNDSRWIPDCGRFEFGIELDMPGDNARVFLLDILIGGVDIAGEEFVGDKTVVMLLRCARPAEFEVALNVKKGGSVSMIK